MGATWHRAALISIHQEMSVGHIQESFWSVSHQGEPCSWLGGVATLQVARFLRPFPQRKGLPG